MEEIKCVQKHEKLPKTSPLKNLDPYLDKEGLLRVGGRIRDANISQGEKNPLIVPGHHHVAALLIKHYHEQTQHQGHLFTEGAVRSSGWWIVGGKRIVSTIIHHCVTCKRLCAPLSTQKMSNLSPDRGPWFVSSQRTRASVIQN